MHDGGGSFGGHDGGGHHGGGQHDGGHHGHRNGGDFIPPAPVPGSGRLSPAVGRFALFLVVGAVLMIFLMLALFR